MSEHYSRFSWEAPDRRLQGAQFLSGCLKRCIVLRETESEARAGERLFTKNAEWNRGNAFFPGPLLREIQVNFVTYFRVIHNLEKRTVRRSQFESRAIQQATKIITLFLVERR